MTQTLGGVGQCGQAMTQTPGGARQFRQAMTQAPGGAGQVDQALAKTHGGDRWDSGDGSEQPTCRVAVVPAGAVLAAAREGRGVDLTVSRLRVVDRTRGTW